MIFLANGELNLCNQPVVNSHHWYTAMNCSMVIKKIPMGNPIYSLHVHFWDFPFGSVSKPMYPCSSDQNSWVKMDVHPIKNGINRY